MEKFCEICGDRIQKGSGYTSHGKVICKACMDEIYEENNGKNKHTSRKRKKTAKQSFEEAL